MARDRRGTGEQFESLVRLLVRYLILHPNAASQPLYRAPENTLAMPREALHRVTQLTVDVEVTIYGIQPRAARVLNRAAAMQG